jgi:hypothetical protein
MALRYGKFLKYAKRNGGAAKSPSKNFRVKLKGRHDLEQLTFLLQTMIARLQDQGVHSVQDCSLYFIPVSREGDPALIKDHAGKPLQTMEISLPVSDRFIKAASV